MWGRLKALTIKELLAVLRDTQGRLILVAPPVLQLVLFSFASTLAIENADIAVLNRDNGAASAEIIQRVSGSPNFRDIISVRSEAELERAIDEQRVICAINFPQGFSADIAAGRTAPLQIIYDGRKSTASQIVNGYLGEILAGAGADFRARPSVRSGTAQQSGRVQRNSEVTVTNVFNPNLEYVWFVLPSLIALISCISTVSVTSQTVARERELGTFEQLMVSPLRVHEILIGKSIPPMLVGLFNSTIFIIASYFVFGVPLRGSLLLLYVALFFYLLAIVGIGLFISSLSKTQQQAFLGTFIFLTPAILLSGYATPIDNIPGWLDVLSQSNPIRHFIVIVQGVFLKEMPASEVLLNTYPLVIISVFTLGIAAWLFRHRME